MSVMTKISTSVPQTTEDVAKMQVAVTLRAASDVPVNQDTMEMDLLAQVSKLKLLF